MAVRMHMHRLSTIREKGVPGWLVSHVHCLSVQKWGSCVHVALHSQSLLGWGLFAACVTPACECVIICVYAPAPHPLPSLLSHISRNKCTLGFSGGEYWSLGTQGCFSWVLRGEGRWCEEELST